MARSQDSRNFPRFENEILPLFQAKCLLCHGEALRQNGLDLRTRDSLLKGGESGPAIIRGSAHTSLLYKKVHSGTMPPGGEKLSSQEVEQIEKWINTGALIQGEDSETANHDHADEVTEQEIQVAIFQSKCITCHGKWVQEAGLDLRSRAGYLKGGKSGAAIVPGQPELSLAYLRIAAGEMPPKVPKGSPHYVRPVTAGEIEKLQRWIASGAPASAKDPGELQDGLDQLVNHKDRRFWSFQPAQCPPLPKVNHSERVRNPIDTFLLKALEAKGLSFSQDGDKLKLMRRAYFDLIGLPPSPEEVMNYLNDLRPNAYERLIDRLLASPHYGERWAKYWLDAAGYADSHGKIDADRVRPNAWRYRDYVIRSLNDDKPYDRFLLEQIAGDELFDYKAAGRLTPEQRDCLVATGFLRTAADDTDEAVLNLVPYRWAVLADQVNIFSSTVMGLTLECARCHSHKYDPIPHRDYYRFSAIFQSALDPFDWRISSTVIYAGEEGQVPIPLQYQRSLNFAPELEVQEVEKFNAPIREEIIRLESSLEARAKPLREKLTEERIEGLPEGLRQDLRKAIRTPKEKRTGVEDYLANRFASVMRITPKELEEKFTDYKNEAEKTRRLVQEAKKALKPLPQIRALVDLGGEPTPAYIFRRGDILKPGARVTPGVPSVIKDGIAPYKVIKPGWTTDTSGQRLALARWLTQPNHPLTARVMVNRIWLQHFGRGLVDTPANFGRIGAKPSNPELLDWLAIEFVRQGWSLKLLHKAIMTSTAYRQSSLVTPPLQEADPENVLLSRFPLRRLDAEAIRDTLVKVSGRLDLTMLGPPEEVQLTPEGEVISKGSGAGFRRSIYLQQRRSLPLTLLELFDAPRMDPNAIMRAHSTVPTQALQLWNSDMVRESSRYLAGRVIDAVGEDTEKQVERVYLTLYARRASDEEITLGKGAVLELSRHWQEQMDKETPAEPKVPKARWLALANYCHTILNSAEFSHID